MPGEDDATVRDSQASSEASDYVPPAPNLAPSIEGQRFGAYQVIREIGRGEREAEVARAVRVGEAHRGGDREMGQGRQVRGNHTDLTEI